MFIHRSCTFPSLDPIYHVSVSRTGGPVILGQSVTLSCDVSGSVDSISWWKNGTAMMTHNMTSLRNRSLTLDSVTKLDAGDYNCQAFNFVSNMTSSPYRLIVNCKYKSIGLSTGVCVFVRVLVSDGRMHVMYFYSPHAVYGYITILMSRGRMNGSRLT